MKWMIPEAFVAGGIVAAITMKIARRMLARRVRADVPPTDLSRFTVPDQRD